MQQAKFVWGFVSPAMFEADVNEALKSLQHKEIVDVKISMAMAGLPELRGGELPYETKYLAVIIWREKSA